MSGSAVLDAFDDRYDAAGFVSSVRGWPIKAKLRHRHFISNIGRSSDPPDRRSSLGWSVACSYPPSACIASFHDTSYPT